MISQDDIIFQAPLSKKQKSTGKLKEYYFVLTKNYLFYLESELKPKIIAMMSTEWVRCDYIYDKPDGKNFLYCIRFVRNMRYTDLYTEDEDHFICWKKKLCESFLQCDFHAKFKTIKMIGKGSFARVYLV